MKNTKYLFKTRFNISRVLINCQPTVCTFYIKNIAFLLGKIVTSYLELFENLKADLIAIISKRLLTLDIICSILQLQNEI